MDDSARREFATMMHGIATLYGKEISKPVIAIWWNALSSYAIDDVRRALNAHVRNPDNGQWMPKPADVVKLLDGTSESAAMIAWSQVMHALKTVGSYSSVAFDDPIIHATIADMGGWIQLGAMTEDEQPFKAREFEKRYAAYLTKGCNSYPALLLGLFDAGNMKDGYDDSGQWITFIGDRDRAVQVLNSGAKSYSAGLAKTTELLEYKTRAEAKTDD